MENDTIKLLRECDAGVQMGIESIDDVRDYVKHPQLKETLISCKREHEKLDSEIQKELARFGDEGKEPSLLLEGMSKMKTEFKLRMKESDQTVADLMTDGCHMGIKSLSRYLNRYGGAEQKAKDLTLRLIRSEESLVQDLRAYL